MFGLISDLLQFLFKAVLVYAASDEGEEQLKAILDEAERDGIDIPFYEPSPEGDEGLTSPNDRGGLGESSESETIKRAPRKNQVVEE